jgi:hypothetical protein
MASGLDWAKCVGEAACKWASIVGCIFEDGSANMPFCCSPVSGLEGRGVYRQLLESLPCPPCGLRLGPPRMGPIPMASSLSFTAGVLG